MRDRSSATFFMLDTIQLFRTLAQDININEADN